jgi:uncharacterized metal-binding protein YceD (DUF177 family)
VVLGKFDSYKVDLKGMRQEVQTYEYLLDNQFFANIGGEDIQKGKVNITLFVTKADDIFDLTFRLKGIAVVPCDRCLDDMDYPIDTEARLIVKLGKDYAEESDEIVVIPESEGVINLAWFLYEFVALAISIKHVHSPGKCNKQMSAKLKKHTAKLESDEENEDAFGMEDEEMLDNDEELEGMTDPRWEALKNLQEF